jgi:hypothetical protein
MQRLTELIAPDDNREKINVTGDSYRLVGPCYLTMLPYWMSNGLSPTKLRFMPIANGTLPYATKMAVGWSLPYTEKIYHNAQWSLPFSALVEKEWTTPYTESTDRRWDLQYGLSVEHEWNLPWIRSLDQSWLLPLYETVRQNWSLSYSLNHALSKQWNVPFTQTNPVSRQWSLVSDLLPLNHVTAQWTCFWELASPPSVTTTQKEVIFTHQGVPVGIGSVQIGIAEDEVAWTGSVEITDQAGFHRIRVNDPVSLTLGDKTYAMIIDNRELSRSGGAKPRMLVRLISVILARQSHLCWS